MLIADFLLNGPSVYVIIVYGVISLISFISTMVPDSPKERRVLSRRNVSFSLHRFKSMAVALEFVVAIFSISP